MFGVALATIGLGFDQNCAAPFARVINRLLRYFKTGNDIVAVDDVAGNAEGGGAFGQIAHGRLLAGRR